MSDFERKVAERLERKKEVKGVDPASSMNGAKRMPRQTDGQEAGRSLYRQLKQAGRIRGL